ncbi:protein teashirt-like [Varroa destructor]|uniref:C2H2-type domain-containing protein n=1 Tax=Varroa destructor TaxID=109461 RepID=A0A7M7MEX4_VARDE|nr:protein teashirt-like [Varroa destructor]
MVVQLQGLLPAEQNPIVPTTRRRPRKRPPRSCRLVVDGEEDEQQQCAARNNNNTSANNNNTNTNDSVQSTHAGLEHETAGKPADAEESVEDQQLHHAGGVGGAAGGHNQPPVGGHHQHGQPLFVDGAEVSPKRNKCDDDDGDNNDESQQQHGELKPDLNDNNVVKQPSPPSPEPIVVAANPLDFSVRRSDDEEDSDSAAALARATPSPQGSTTDAVDMSAPDAPLDLSKKPSGGNNRMTSSTRVAPLAPNSRHQQQQPQQQQQSNLPALTLSAAAAISPLASLASKIEAAQWTPSLKTSLVSTAPTRMDWKPAPPAKQPKLDAHGLKTRDSFRPSNRQNPWQSQWISRSGEQTKDVFTCVWCKEQFQSLEHMTVHMKNSPRCGMAGMHAAASTSATPASTAAPASAVPAAKAQHTPQQVQATQHQANAPHTPHAQQQQPPQQPTTKDGVPLPRKLVRGQDVWLGKGAEQTRQILKCMWCGQSFKSLADMTQHMKVTQHYTNIISQEQIVSWKSPEEKAQNQSQVNAVLTCKVCDQAFSSLKELSYHMVKNNHYKDNLLRSIGDIPAMAAAAAVTAAATTAVPPTQQQPQPKRTPVRGDRGKKSLPVRKLLELERQACSPEQQQQQQQQALAMGRINCEECGEKVEAKDFVAHVKQCSRLFGGSGGMGGREDDDDSESHRSATPKSVDSVKEHNESFGPSASSSAPGSSVLASLEKLVEKSFDGKGKRQASSGILQRLGIDEEVYPPWHPAGSPRNFNSAIAAAQMLKSPGSSEGPDHPSRGSTPSGFGRAQYGGSSPDRQSSRSAPSPAGAGAHVRASPAPSESSTRASSPGVPDNLVIADDKSAARQLLTRSPGGESAASLQEDRLPLAKTGPVTTPQKGKKKDNPLRELEKLLDKTETQRVSNAASAQPGIPGLPGAAGSILAFSWACGEGATASPEGTSIKCAFCDTHFVSKGAYRHHLSKMHFIKSDNNSDTDKNSERGSVSPAPSQPPSVASDGGASSTNESPHSKFLKYAELAKQLSSKYV